MRLRQWGASVCRGEKWWWEGIQSGLAKSWWRLNFCSPFTTVQELGMLNEIGR